MIVVIGVLVTILLLVTLLSYGSGAAKRGDLLRGMRKLDDVTQHTYDDVVATLGPPNSISAVGNGVRLAQWISHGYHVAMSFGPDGQCLGIDLEVAV